MNSKVVFESPTVQDKRLILSYLRKRKSIYIIEPFHAYHHRGSIRFFPPQLPGYIDELIRERKLLLIPADSFDSRSIYTEAANRAVSAVNEVYPFYRQAVQRVIRLVSYETGANVEKAFKKNFCDRLGDFFSLNLLIHRISQIFETESFDILPNTNITAYEFYLKLIKKSGYPFFECKNAIIPNTVRKSDNTRNLFNRFNLIFKLILQSIGSLIIPTKDNRSIHKSIKKYKFGISIVAPRRQFRGNQRGVDFLVDNIKIFPRDIIYLPLVDLNESQKLCLAKTGSDITYLPRLGRFFSNWSTWIRLVVLSTRKGAVPNCDLIEVAAITLFTFYRWKYLLKDIQFDHFITHSDFTNSHIARNLLLQQKGTTTWYFTDASNFGHSFRKSDVVWNCHPFWAFQDYDNLLTWNDDLAEYFSKHPESYRKTHVIGSLWSSHVNKSIDRQAFLMNFFDENIINEKFVIIAYASTYTVNGITSYEEGIEFAHHLEKLAEEINDVLILLKEKKETSLHIRLDPRRGSELINLYERMDRHQRIRICSNKMDTSAAMSICNMCISFPYTSTTNEAIGFGIPAIWHDPNENYRDTPYAKHGNLVTHGYAELRQKVINLRSTVSEKNIDPTRSHSSLFDPYRDGKAIDRFRDLLCRNYDR